MGGFLEKLGMTLEQLAVALQTSPSLRGILVGYLAEVKLVEMYFDKFGAVKTDDHDRGKKGDRWIMYEGTPISIEVKSLQTNSVKEAGDGWKGAFQVDASDCRTAALPNGHRIQTTCLVVGGFDLLAVNLFEFGHRWRFAFAHNYDLPRSPKYSPEDRQYLLQTTPRITWPLKPPFESESWALLDRIVREKASRKR